ncbi:unnamed protein product [Clavelina lepadiformis]|uniref:Uncharacterized protein n=1 Tax=Clavelina lepadiformis TaxID=159417 RepID=A0ABP0G652_CLALP
MRTGDCSTFRIENSTQAASKLSNESSAAVSDVTNVQEKRTASTKYSPTLGKDDVSAAVQPSYLRYNVAMQGSRQEKVIGLAQAHIGDMLYFNTPLPTPGGLLSGAGCLPLSKADEKVSLTQSPDGSQDQFENLPDISKIAKSVIIAQNRVTGRKISSVTNKSDEKYPDVRTGSVKVVAPRLTKSTTTANPSSKGKLWDELHYTSSSVLHPTQPTRTSQHRKTRAGSKSLNVFTRR